MSDAKRVCKDIFPDVDLERPRYDQSTYLGRAKHFFIITNPLNVFASSRDLENARNIVQHYRCKKPLPFCITEDELWRAKQLYDSAFHPDTGAKMNLVGRMSAQVPMNMLITAGMMAFYKTTPAVLFWQWINQSFNALVNYTNRSGDSPITEKQLMTSYILATTGAFATALTFKRVFRNSPPIYARFVPFLAVVAANCINIPIMRSQELRYGTPVFDQNGIKLGYSTNAAQNAISSVILSRIAMFGPPMLITPYIMNHLERRGTLCRYPWAEFPINLALISAFLVFTTPFALAFFNEQSEMKFCSLEPPLRRKIYEKYGKNTPYIVFYNKGL